LRSLRAWTNVLAAVVVRRKAVTERLKAEPRSKPGIPASGTTGRIDRRSSLRVPFIQIPKFRGWVAKISGRPCALPLGSNSGNAKASPAPLPGWLLGSPAQSLAVSSARISWVVPVSPTRGTIRVMLCPWASASMSVNKASLTSVTWKLRSCASRTVDSTPALVA